MGRIPRRLRSHRTIATSHRPTTHAHPAATGALTAHAHPPKTTPKSTKPALNSAKNGTNQVATRRQFASTLSPWRRADQSRIGGQKISHSRSRKMSSTRLCKGYPPKRSRSRTRRFHHPAKKLTTHTTIPTAISTPKNTINASVHPASDDSRWLARHSPSSRAERISRITSNTATSQCRCLRWYGGGGCMETPADTFPTRLLSVGKKPLGPFGGGFGDWGSAYPREVDLNRFHAMIGGPR